MKKSKSASVYIVSWPPFFLHLGLINLKGSYLIHRDYIFGLKASKYTSYAPSFVHAK